LGSIEGWNLKSKLSRVFWNGKRAIAIRIGGGRPRGRGDPVVESLRRVALKADAGSIPDCGHFIPEQKPAELVTGLREFLTG
jgi:pimeloyl-ACP methyl ester carboxylesterase